MCVDALCFTTHIWDEPYPNNGTSPGHNKKRERQKCTRHTKPISLVHFAWMLGLQLFANKRVFRIKPPKVKTFSRGTESHGYGSKFNHQGTAGLNVHGSIYPGKPFWVPFFDLHPYANAHLPARIAPRPWSCQVKPPVQALEVDRAAEEKLQLRAEALGEKRRWRYCGWLRNPEIAPPKKPWEAIACWYLRWGIESFQGWCEMDFVHPQ